MSRRKIIITHSDRRRLQHLLASEFPEAINPKKYLTDLEAELQRAKIVDSADVPCDVITMDSTFRLRDVDTGEVETNTFVYPEQANIAENKLSILAPIGTAILGYCVGDVVRWRVPSGNRRLRVEELLYQPEREGMLTLLMRGWEVEWGLVVFTARSITMPMLHKSQPDSIRKATSSEDAECKFCYGSTSYGLSICNDCYREPGTGE